MSRIVDTQALEFDAEGRPYSKRYGDFYASRDGAIGQARHVFLEGNGLPGRWAGQRHFVILETGFGLGNNFLATWLAWRCDPLRPRRLHFVSVEKHPLRREDLLAQVCAPSCATDPPGLGELRRQLASRWPPPLAGLHHIEFEGGQLILTLALGDAASLVPRLQLGADAIYLDGFAPDRNPRMWDASLMKALSRLARPGASAASYTCARAVREALAVNGFAVELAPGYGSKRDMLRAHYRPQWKTRRHEPPALRDGPEHAIIVGAGLAGCSCAYSLRRRGWRVTLLERGAAVATAASALPAGLLHPLLSADDNLTSRLSRAGFLFSLDLLRQLDPLDVRPRASESGAGALWSPCGVFHQAEDDAEAQALQAALAAKPWPENFAVFRQARQMTDQLGLAPRHGGTWFAGGAVVASARWCHALVAAAGAGRHSCEQPRESALELILHAEVVDIARQGEGWQVRDALGRRYQAPVLVLANAGGLARLHNLSSVTLQQISGRISLLRAPALSGLRAGISGDGYVIPPLLGTAAVGATYEFGLEVDAQIGAKSRAEEHATQAAHRANQQRLEKLLARPESFPVEGVFAAHRWVSQDRLPLAGQLIDESKACAAGARLNGMRLPDLPRLPGLYCLAALGSRGMSLAPLLGEYLAAQINGEPAPLEADLAAAVDPGRFVLRQQR